MDTMQNVFDIAIFDTVRLIVPSLVLGHVDTVWAKHDSDSYHCQSYITYCITVSGGSSHGHR